MALPRFMSVGAIERVHRHAIPASGHMSVAHTSPSAWDQRERWRRRAQQSTASSRAERLASTGSRRGSHMVVDYGHGGRKELPSSRLPRRLLGICCC